MKALWMLVIPISVVVLFGCGKSQPACGDQSTIDLVKKTCQDGLQQDIASIGRDKAAADTILNAFQFVVSSVRTAGRDDKVGKLTCEAVLEVKLPEVLIKASDTPFFKNGIANASKGSARVNGSVIQSDIQYTSQLSDDKKQRAS